MRKLSWLLLAGLMAVFTACSNADDEEPGGGGGIVPPPTTDPLKSYLEEFSVITEGYKDADVWVPTWTCEKVSGDRNWQGYIYTDNSTNIVSKFLQASAHDSQDSNKGTHYESWVITPPLNVKEATEKVFSFRSSGNFWKETSSLKVYVLSEPKSTAATKKELNVPIVTSGQYTWVDSGDISLAGEGDVVYIGFCYIAEGGASNSTTYRIDDFAFGRKQTAHGGDEEEEPVNPNPDTDLDISDAITVAAAMEYNNAEKKIVTVKGYMVGCIKGSPSKTSYSSAAEAEAAGDLEWKAAFTGSTTVLIADKADETDPSKCLFVKLNDKTSDYPGATGLRDAASLKDNPDNLGKVLAVKGKKMAVYGLAGIRDMEGWKLVK